MKLNEMTWEQCDNPVAMLQCVKDRISPRKAYLFGIHVNWKKEEAGIKRGNHPTHDAIAITAHLKELARADSGIRTHFPSFAELAVRPLLETIQTVQPPRSEYLDEFGYAMEAITSDLNRAVSRLSGAFGAWYGHPDIRCALLRELLGNPFAAPWNLCYCPQCGRTTFPVGPEDAEWFGKCPDCEVKFTSPAAPVFSWNDGAVIKMADAIYQDQQWADCPILADMAEEAGLVNEAMLRHLREPGTHVRGCWVLDALTGRE